MRQKTIAFFNSFLFATLLAAGAFVSPARAQPAEKSIASYVHEAPFPMSVPMLPQIPGRAFTITDYGAVGDGLTLCTDAFEKTIAACAAAGGGQVLVPPGAWLSGPIQLKSNIDLHLEKNALILFSRDHALYARAPDGKNNSGMIPPLSGRDLENIAITGEGIIDGAGDSWRPVKKEKMTPSQWKMLIAAGGVLNQDASIWWPSQQTMINDAQRPVLLLLNNCKRILLRDITLRNSPKFACYPGHCSDLTLDHVTVFNEWWAQNGDGIDISACKRVVLYKCTVSAGDDAICMKSSGPPQPALSEIIIAGCTVYHGHGGFVIGSNTDGGIRNIAVSDCSFIGTDVGLRFKSNMGRGGRVENIYINNIIMHDIVNEAVLFDTWYEDAPAGSAKDPAIPRPTDKTPEFRDFHISNIYCSGARTAIRITGLPRMKVNSISFADMVISSVKGLIASQAENIQIARTRLIVSEGAPYQTDGTASVNVSDH